MQKMIATIFVIMDKLIVKIYELIFNFFSIKKYFYQLIFYFFYRRLIIREDAMIANNTSY